MFMGEVPTVVARATWALFSAFLVSLVFGRWLLRRLQAGAIEQTVRANGPVTHLHKSGTPTMGGLMILVAAISSTLLWADLTNPFVLPALLILVGYGAVGALDDYRKIVRRDPRGMGALEKYGWQSLLALLAAIYLGAVLVTQAHGPLDLLQRLWQGTSEAWAPIQLTLPFHGGVYTINWPLFLVLAYFVLVGTSNAVNLTDGLDGLVSVPIAVVAATLGVFALVVGNEDRALSSRLAHVAHSEELLVLCAALVGALLAFLRYNLHPAQVFMGDVGSLPLGAVLGWVALVLRLELLLCVLGVVFIIETLSVILQVFWFKRTGRRWFKMAPFHHHLELSGWKETEVVLFFWLLSALLAGVALAFLFF